MSFIVTSPDEKVIVDILVSRQLPYLKTYYREYSIKASLEVKIIVIDMYQPYVSLIKDLFPKAIIIYDRFHIKNHLMTSLSNTRIETMKKFKTNSMEYKRLKRYWKLIVKDFVKLDARIYNSRVHFYRSMTEAGTVNETVEVDPILQETYNAYQILINDINTLNYNALREHMEYFKDRCSKHMQTTIRSLLKDFNYVKNALTSHRSNGFTEGINNFIKVLKRIAFGYK